MKTVRLTDDERVFLITLMSRNVGVWNDESNQIIRRIARKLGLAKEHADGELASN